MLKELFEAINEQAVSAAGPHFEESDPTKIYAVRKPDGTVEFVGGRVPWRKHKAQDLETIAAFSDKFKTAAIWYSREMVVCLTNDAERFDRITVDLIRSQQAAKLMDLQTTKPLMPQRDFLFMLRTVFTANAFPTAPKLIDTLRSVKFEAGQKTDGVVQRGKSSVGKELSASATFLDAVPEQVTVSVPMFDNSFAKRSYDVICALEIHEVEMRLQLFPLPGEVEKAFAAAEADLSQDIRNLIGNDKVPVYYGCP